MELNVHSKLLASYRRCARVVVAIALLAAFVSIGIGYAATAAGTVIKNQASASYRDATGVLRYATSNIVETLIQQVAAIQLTQNQTRLVVAGRQTYLTHRVTNAGNGPDSFSLTAKNTTADGFDVSGINLYADADQNGQPDVFVPVSSTPELAMHESWSFVVAALVPAGTPAGDTAVLEIQAVSNLNNASVATNTDTVVVADGAVIEMSKSISATSGKSPGGPYTVTLSYQNIGTASAGDVTIIDALPVGMEYVAGSASWSGAASLVIPDDTLSAPVGSDPYLSYCSYQASCGGLPEAHTDIDADSSNQLTAIISTVLPGESGSLSFDIQIAAGLHASALANTAEFEYTSNSVVSLRETTNTVTFKVLHEPAVVLNGSAVDTAEGVEEPLVVASMAQSTSVVFGNVVWNTGNATDTFDISFDRVVSTFPTGTIVRILQSDGMTPLPDTNGNGTPDTGPLRAGESYPIVLQVTPPADVTGNNSGNGYEVTVVATSASDASVSNQMLNRLLDISVASVDITHLAALSDTNAVGGGAGPEVTPVSVFTATPGSTVAIDLFLNNTGQVAVGLDLSVSTEQDFSTLSLPHDWQVEFRLPGDNTALTNTGLIDAGDFTLVEALVTLPVNAEPGDTSLFFRAISDLTGAVDITHDQITVSAVRQVLLEPDQNGQTNAGGSYVYHHTLSNVGNVAIDMISLEVSDNTSGWNSIVYEDTNGDGKLDSSDQVVESVGPLDAGAITSLFVKVFAPTGAAPMTVNQTTLTAARDGGANTIQNIDTTTVADIEINIVKEQAPDYGCTGVPDGAYGVGGFSVEPGNNCVSYRLTATNAGQATAFNVEIADATPAFTSYFGVAQCTHGSCTVQEPLAGGQGNVVASIPALDAGDAVVLNFSVRVE